MKSNLNIQPEVDRIFNKLAKKDHQLLMKVIKKIELIRNNPYP